MSGLRVEMGRKIDMTIKRMMSGLHGGFLYGVRKNTCAATNVIYFYMRVYILKIIMHSVGVQRNVHVVGGLYPIGIINVTKYETLILIIILVSKTPTHTPPAGLCFVNF